MQSVLIITFDEVNDVKITEEFMEQHPEVLKSGEKLMQDFVKGLHKYFKQHRIKSTITCKVA